tara:strand:+ start:850 stop:2151 length:1302 start_codon:yes stop_codon:yes gene_type:complete
MKLLRSTNELRAFLSPAENAAYLSDAWDDNAQMDMVSDEVKMDFTNPNRGHLIIKGGYKAGLEHFLVKFSSRFESVTENLDSINRCLILIGDAQTGLITSILIDHGDHNSADRYHLPEVDWADIQRCLSITGDDSVWLQQKEGFRAFSAGEIMVPPVIYLPFEGRGDLHLKGAHRYEGDIYVFKIATAFPNNVERGLQPSQGIMLAFDARTAEPIMVLRDEGHLTDMRTAIAGRNAAEEMMPANALMGVGVLGTGVQARLQIALLKNLYPACNKLTVWGRSRENTINYAKEVAATGWDVSIVDSPKQVADSSNLLITTTASEVALLDANDISMQNTVIIAIGADMPGKVELSPALLQKAQAILIDSIPQGIDHGNAAVAIRDNIIRPSDLQEFGDFLTNGYRKPEAKDKLRIFLSSGIGVQDLQIVQSVIEGS